MQRSFNKYGEESFKHYILEECKREDLDEKEKSWIKKLNTYKNGYNMNGGGSGCYIPNPTDEYREKMRRMVMGTNNPNYGHKWTEEMKRNLSQKKIGKNLNENNPNAKSVICVETLKIYKTQKDAAKELHIKNTSSISRCLLNKQNLAYGYHFVLYTKEMYEYLLNNQFEYLCECNVGRKIYADMTNKRFYLLKDMMKKLYPLLNCTQREPKQFLKQEKFNVNNVEYVLL